MTGAGGKPFGPCLLETMAGTRKPRKPSAASVKAAAERAELRSKGEEVEAAPTPLDPPIIPAEVLLKPKTIAKRRGRRSKYTRPLGKAICKMLSRGVTLTSLCKRPLMPREETVLAWASDPDHEFSRQYTRAREVGYIRMGDQILDIADDASKDYRDVVGKDGAVIKAFNREAIERSKLRIDTRKWLLSKALPKVFGDKVALEHTGRDGGPIETKEAPQATGNDHLADVAKRYAAKMPAATVPVGKPADPKAKGQKGGAGLH